MSPEGDRRHLRLSLESLKRACGAPIGHEIKLKDVSERHYVEFLQKLSVLNGVVYAVATDAGFNNARDIEEHQAIQAAKIVEHKDKMLYAAAREGLQTLSDNIGSLAPQLYVQLHCQIILIETLLRNGVLYFVQRHPQNLGYFRWRIDQKNSEQTEYERAFVMIAPAFLQTMSLRSPVAMLEGADYSAFSRFDWGVKDKPKYLRDTYGIEIKEEELSTNIGMLLRENLSFVDSKSNAGVQVADLIASGIRRCLRMGFLNNELVAALLGRLMVQNFKGHPPIQLLALSSGDLHVDAGVGNLIRIMWANARAMVR